MADIQVYKGAYTGAEIDASIGKVTDTIPSGATSSNKCATASDITSITEKIPAAASSSNQLADKAYVTSIVGDINTVLEGVL